MVTGVGWKVYPVETVRGRGRMGGGNRIIGRGKKEGRNGNKQGERGGGRDIHCIYNEYKVIL